VEVFHCSLNDGVTDEHYRFVVAPRAFRLSRPSCMAFCKRHRGSDLIPGDGPESIASLRFVAPQEMTGTRASCTVDKDRERNKDLRRFQYCETKLSIAGPVCACTECGALLGIIRASQNFPHPMSQPRITDVG
jgi:hypothetical protein